jgi:hypothetical protein
MHQTLGAELLSMPAAGANGQPPLPQQHEGLACLLPVDQREPEPSPHHHQPELQLSAACVMYGLAGLLHHRASLSWDQPCLQQGAGKPWVCVETFVVRPLKELAHRNLACRIGAAVE